MKKIALVLALAGLVPLGGVPATACGGYGARPSLTVSEPRAYSVNVRPFEITGTATGGSCSGVDYPVSQVTVGVWPPLAGGPNWVGVECTGCPGMSVTWKATVTAAHAPFPALYTVDAAAKDTAGGGATQRWQIVVL